MARFKITWDSGVETEYEQSDCSTVEQFINCRFGAGAKPTAKVELVVDKVEAVPEPVTPKPKAAAPEPKASKPAK